MPGIGLLIINKGRITGKGGGGRVKGTGFIKFGLIRLILIKLG